jgi:aconitate hydratase
VIFAGKEYGSGSSRDWAAKGTMLLGVKAVIAESFERIHRSNLVGMGVIPFEFTGGDTRKSLGLKGDETVSIRGLSGALKPRQMITAEIGYGDGSKKSIQILCRIDTEIEIEYVEHGGVLHYVLRNLAGVAA